MAAIYEREVKSFFKGMTGYLLAAFILIFVGIYILLINLQALYPNFEYVLNSLTFVFIIITPILTMRVFAEERKQKTDQLLYSLPVSMTKVMLGKYLAMLTVFALPTVIMCFYPIILSNFGSVNLATAYSAILGFFLMGASLIAIGMFISSVTENQIIAAVLCLLVVLVNYFIVDLASAVSSTAITSFIALTVCIVVVAIIVRLLTKSIWAAIGIGAVLEAALLVIWITVPRTLEGLFPKVMQQISVFERYNVFSGGVLDITSAVYFILISVLFMFFTVQSLEKRRWS